MAPKHYTVGPGKLSLSSSSSDFSAQVTACTVSATASRGDTVHVLSGDSIAGESTYTGSLAVSLLQDLSASGIVDFSWKNAGKEVAFTYTPNTAEGAKITGKATVDPISIGGEAKARATSEFTWECAELPTFTPKATGGG